MQARPRDARSLLTPNASFVAGRTNGPKPCRTVLSIEISILSTNFCQCARKYLSIKRSCDACHARRIDEEELRENDRISADP